MVAFKNLQKKFQNLVKQFFHTLLRCCRPGVLNQNCSVTHILPQPTNFG